MHNFWRALKLTFKYKWNIVGIIISSLCLALCWGGNIATVYPLVQVSFQGDTVSGWLDKEITSQTDRLSNLKKERDEILGKAGSKEQAPELTTSPLLKHEVTSDSAFPRLTSKLRTARRR